MFDSPGVRRVILVVLDGLRPDAIERFGLAHLSRLMEAGASTRDGLTVSPPITTAAMASLFTGVRPSTHGITRDRIMLSGADPSAVSLASLLSHAGHPTSAFLAELPLAVRPLIGRIQRRLGLGVLRTAGRSCDDILDAAKPTLHDQRKGLIVLHWPDADRAGHRFGWMSEPYGAAARRMDNTLGKLAEFCAIPHDANTLLILLTDHGGGGVRAKDHADEHPINRRIFVAMSGGGVAAAELRQVTLLDIAPTILWALGLEPPPVYEGRVLEEAFGRAALEAEVVA